MSHREAGAALAVPVICWHGWRPAPLDLDAGEQGGQTFLVLGREGDTALLPVAMVTYICYAPLGPDDRWEDHGLQPVEVSSAAAQRQAVLQEVRELEDQGWRVVGRLQATFNGVDTEDDFWQRVEWTLRDPPGAPKKGRTPAEDST